MDGLQRHRKFMRGSVTVQTSSAPKLRNLIYMRPKLNPHWGLYFFRPYYSHLTDYTRLGQRMAACHSFPLQSIHAQQYVLS
ncbi:unnamed protein product [Amoebophrya sp. A25]|nr:unnamed protein product [Amoebophrya sp. A25]|eukprot:GSA25T00008042001.1